MSDPLRTAIAEALESLGGRDAIVGGYTSPFGLQRLAESIERHIAPVLAAEYQRGRDEERERLEPWLAHLEDCMSNHGDWDRDGGEDFRPYPCSCGLPESLPVDDLPVSEPDKSTPAVVSEQEGTE